MTLATEPARRPRRRVAPPVEPPPDQATAWARAVVAGDVLTGKLVRLAAARHLRDLERTDGRIRWDVERSERAIAFFGKLKHSKGKWAGQAFVLSPWQAFIVGCLFGWLNADGTRRFRVAYSEIPRKNGKSTLAAGLALLLAFFDGEAGAEVYCAATKRDQAKIVWSEAKRMVQATPDLRKRIDVLTANLSRETSKLEPLGADADSTDGLNPHGVIIDELHAHKNGDLVQVLQTASGAREQPMRVEITTAGHDRTSVCREHHDYSRRVLEGTVQDETWFGFIATCDNPEDWTNPVEHAKANLNLGVSVNPAYIEAQCARARKMTSERNAFLRLHLNVWPNQSETWIPLEAWNAEACARPIEDHAGERVYVGLDQQSPRDLLTAAYLWGPDDDGVFDVRLRCWLPEEALTSDGAPSERQAALAAWADDHITLTPGEVVDYDRIRDDLLEDLEPYDVGTIGYNRRELIHLGTKLIDSMGKERVVAQGQEYAAISAACKRFEALVAAAKLRHGGNPILAWTVAQVAVAHGPNEAIKIDRENSPEKVAIAALVIAIAQMEKGPAPEEQWDGRVTPLA